VRDPAAPGIINDSDYPTPDPLTGFDIPEGNGHQAWWSSNNQFVLGTDEDFSPTRTNCRIETGPNAGPTPCGEFGFSVPLSTQFPSGFSGTTVWGGSGCEEDVDGNGTSDRAEVLASYTKAQTGADAIVFSRGICFFSKKIETGELAGYKMVFIGQSHGGSRNGLLPNSFFCGGQGSPVLGQASAGCIGHLAMHQLFNDAPEYTGGDTLDMPAKGTLGERIFAQGGVFDGWGYVHLLNANTLQEIDAYAVPEGLDPAFQTGFGNLTVHEVQTDPRATVNLAYISYYDAGFRVVKFGKNGMQEVGHFIDQAETTSGASSQSVWARARARRSSRRATAISASTSSGTRGSRARTRMRFGPAPGDGGWSVFDRAQARAVVHLPNAMRFADLNSGQIARPTRVSLSWSGLDDLGGRVRSVVTIYRGTPSAGLVPNPCSYGQKRNLKDTHTDCRIDGPFHRRGQLRSLGEGRSC
jgi:hypothetical protein